MELEKTIKFYLQNPSVVLLRTDDPFDTHDKVIKNIVFSSKSSVYDCFDEEIRRVKVNNIKELNTKTIVYFKSNYKNGTVLDIAKQVETDGVILDYKNDINTSDIDKLQRIVKQKNLKYFIVSKTTINNIYLQNIEIPLPTKQEIYLEVEAVLKKNKVNSSTQLREQIASYLLGLPFSYIRESIEYAIYKFKNGEGDFFKSLLKKKKDYFNFNLSMEFIEEIEDINSLGGQNILKSWLKERHRGFLPEAERAGLPSPKGVLLVGIQGCGKSLTAKSISSLWKIPLLKMDFSLLFSSNKTPEELFKENLILSEKLSPVILWLDEIDKLFSASSSPSIELKRIFATFLTWLQEKKSQVFVVATANKIDDIPPELLRKGRFDEIFFLDLPSEIERLEIFKIHLKKRGINWGNFDIDKLVSKSNFFSGAEIEQVVISALYKAFYEKREITEEDILYTIEEVVPFYKTYEEEIKKLKNWAEDKARKASENVELYQLFE